MSDNKYIGITVGPIFDTINLTSSPAALWAASYMFSSLTRFICEILTDKTGDYKLPEDAIVSPFYEKDSWLLNKHNGVGLFHDRIIFRADNFDYGKMPEIKEKAIEKVCELYGIENKSYLKEYIAIYSAEFSATNPISQSSKLLDALELSKPFVFEEEENPIFSLFVNADGRSDESGMIGKNEAIKKIICDFQDFQLIKKKHGNDCILKSLSDIAKTGTGLKKFKYYAILRSDGDNMSEIISSLKSDKEITDFSRICFKYCADAAKLTGSYGGATIYSGGDDLLAILPCEKDQKNIFDFIAKLNQTFSEAFKQYNKPTSLSFGVTIAYYKFPLYEALAESANLLFNVAKDKKQKNCSVVKLQKHAGQSSGLLISNDAIPKIIKFMDKVKTQDSELLLSAMHKLNLFKEAFNQAEAGSEVENLSINTFDAVAHTDNDFVKSDLPEMINSLKKGTKIFAFDNKINETDPVLTMCYILRMMKFFIEKDGNDKK